MQHIDYRNHTNKVHFIGIGGISMSGLAEILKTKGFTVSGSDIKRSTITDYLEKKGIQVFINQKASNISTDIDLIVYTAAIKSDNEELKSAIDKNIPIIDRATLLGEIMSNYKYSIGVSGTHGKTTTTSMISHILLEAKKDPTITVGGILDIISGNIKIGTSDYFIAESCEYYDSFLKFYPYIGVILNIDKDHLDYFKDINHIRNSFHSYAKNIDDNGFLIINGDMDHLDEILDDINCTIITVGINSKQNTFSAVNIDYVNNLYPKFDILYKDNLFGTIQLNVPGIHNISNALCAIAVSHILGINFDTIKNGLFNFKGTRKRFELKGHLKGITIIDDYAHHPTEIKATLNVAKSYPHKHLWCVFQPHTYSRTKAFLKDFAKALSLADKVILSDIYAAREKNPGDIHSKNLLKVLQEIGVDSYYFPTFNEIENFLLENCSPGDLLITMGAGDISIIGNELLGL